MAVKGEAGFQRAALTQNPRKSISSWDFVNENALVYVVENL
jgi:hypothetical protein